MHHLPSRYIPCDGRLTAYAYFKSTLPVGGATPGSLRGTSQSGISIHAPRRGSDDAAVVPAVVHTKFQSTLPAGGATGVVCDWRRLMVFQSTLPVGGATDTIITAIREILFQSTLPAWGATVQSKHTAMTA